MPKKANSTQFDPKKTANYLDTVLPQFEKLVKAYGAARNEERARKLICQITPLRNEILENREFGRLLAKDFDLCQVPFIRISAEIYCDRRPSPKLVQTLDELCKQFRVSFRIPSQPAIAETIEELQQRRSAKGWWWVKEPAEELNLIKPLTSHIPTIPPLTKLQVYRLQLIEQLNNELNIRDFLRNDLKHDDANELDWYSVCSLLSRRTTPKWVTETRDFQVSDDPEAVISAHPRSQSSDTDCILSVSEAALLLDIDAGTVSRMVKNQKLASNGKHGKDRRVSKSAVDELKAKRRARSETETYEQARQSMIDAGINPD